MILKRSKLARFVLGMIRQHAPRPIAVEGGGLVVSRAGAGDYITLDAETLAKLAALPAPTLPTTSGANVQMGPTAVINPPVLPALGPRDL